MKNTGNTNLLQKSSLEAKKLKQIQTLNTLKSGGSSQFNINLDPVNLALNSADVKNKKSYLIKKSTPGSETKLSKKKGLANIYPYLLNNINHISLTPFIGIKNGVLLKYQKIISYKFNGSNTTNINNIVPSQLNVTAQKLDIQHISELLYYFFKSIYCLISKPVYLHSSDKVIIQLFYYLCIPKKKVFKFFSIKYISSFKNKWLKKKSQAFSIRKNNKILPYSSFRSSNRAKSDKLFIK